MCWRVVDLCSSALDLSKVQIGHTGNETVDTSSEKETRIDTRELGFAGATLRELETRHNVFLVFENDVVRDQRKRLYALGRDKRACDDVVDEVMEAVAARVQRPSSEDST